MAIALSILTRNSKRACYNWSVTKIPIAIIHATRASIEPVNHYYTHCNTANAPQFDIFNLLDDGLMRYLASNDVARSTKRFLQMMALARDEYGAKLAMLTCSAVPASTMAVLRDWDPSFPVIKIDEPMAKLAVASGRNIGVIASFPATIATTEGLLHAAGAKSVHSICVPQALEALFNGDPARHNHLIHTACLDLISQAPTDVVILAQVSMAHLAPELCDELQMPVFGSLDTSLAAIKSLVLP